MRFAAGLIVLAAACAPAPQAPAPSCPCPPLKPEAETARYEARAFSELPGWSNAQLEPSLRAFVAARRAPLVAIFQRAQDRGEIGAAVDFELAFDVLTGPIMYRLYFSGGTVDGAMVEETIDLVLRGLPTG